MHRRSVGSSVIKARRLQRSFGDGLIVAEINDLQETWMQHTDMVLEDDAIISAVHHALEHRHPTSRSRGRPGFLAEVVLRLLIIKHVRNWSYAVLEREVRANLVDRDFTRVGADKMPDAKTMGRWGIALGPAVIKQVHAAKLGRVPRLVAADAGFYSAKNEAAAKAKGVKRVCIPNRGSKSAARKREHKKRWFRDGQRWRTGCEGRISVSKRRHGLQRCRYRGDDGMRRWVGLGVIADNRINIGRAIAAHPAT